MMVLVNNFPVLLTLEEGTNRLSQYICSQLANTHVPEEQRPQSQQLLNPLPTDEVSV
jgi:predicted P-loop ATPase/GTPase